MEEIALSRAVVPNDWDWDTASDLQDNHDDVAPEEFLPECEIEGDWINFGNRLVENPDYREWVGWREREARLFSLRHNFSWVVVGGESGPGARPMHPQWARDLRDECQETGIPYFYKQHGAWLHEEQHPEWVKLPEIQRRLAGRQHEWPDGSVSVCVGKHRAGRLLDGREWNEMPAHRR